MSADKTEAERNARLRVKSQIERVIASVNPFRAEVKGALEGNPNQDPMDKKFEALLISLQDIRKTVEYQIQLDLEIQAEEFGDLPIESE
jgi:hypothetical protein